MTPSKTETLLEHMQVPEWHPYYVLGCFERRVTLFSQQVRALNLVWSLFREDRVAKGDKVAIIGGGAAGLTAAAAALHLGAEVTVLESHQSILNMQRGCLHRWLHPHIYHWPEEGSEKPEAGLPLLNWSASSADDVAQQLERGWSAWEGKARVFRNVGRIAPEKSGRLTWHAPGVRTDTFKIVILAVGFGIEEAMGSLPSPSYWSGENLHKPDPTGKATRVLVSGCGDGGLIDLLRVRIFDFRQDQVVSRLSKCEEIDALKALLNDIEHEARSIYKREGSASNYLLERYQALSVHPSIDRAFPRRTDTAAVLCSLDGKPYTLEASPLNRFLVSRLLHGPDGRVELRQGRLDDSKIRRSGAKFEVDFDDGPSDQFDQVVLRHGPTSALKKHFPVLYKACEPLRARNALDQTRGNC